MKALSGRSTDKMWWDHYLPLGRTERLLRGWDADWVWRVVWSEFLAKATACVVAELWKAWGIWKRSKSLLLLAHVLFPWHCCLLGRLSPLPLHTLSFLCPPPSTNVRVPIGLPHGPLLILFTFPFTHLLTPHWPRNESSISPVRIRINHGLVKMQILQVCINIWYLFCRYTG